MQFESTIYFLHAFVIIGAITFILLFFQIFRRHRITVGICALAIWSILSFLMLSIHVFAGMGIAHSNPNQLVTSEGIIKLVVGHLAYLLIGIGLVYWVGKRNKMLN